MKQPSYFGPVNMLEFGAKGDGVTDDAPAIQEAINLAADRGGGKLFFPFTPHGYRIARPAPETVDGKACRGQLYIPFKPDCRPNITLEGEMPCKLLNRYIGWCDHPNGRTEIAFQFPAAVNTFLFSDWDAPEEHDPAARPWSLLCALEGTLFAGKFGPRKVSVVNLEFRVKLNPDKMYPTMSAANLQNAETLLVRESQFCLDRHIGDFKQRKILQPNPCHTAGLIASGDQNDDNLIYNAASQGFRYGFVFGEHVIADCLYVHNTEAGIVFHDCSHQSHLHHVVAQHNQVIFSAPAEKELFGMPCSGRPVFVQVDGVDFEPGGPGYEPAVSNMLLGVRDPENRFHGKLYYHCGCPVNKQWFPVEGGRNFHCRPLNPVSGPAASD